MAFMNGNLCYQIEHHLFPDLPSNRYAEISERVRALCEKYDLPYTTGPLARQYWQSFWTIFKLALPDKLLKATSDDAPETNSELKFRIREGVRESCGVDPATGTQRTAYRGARAPDCSHGHRVAVDPRSPPKNRRRPAASWGGAPGTIRAADTVRRRSSALASALGGRASRSRRVPGPGRSTHR